MLNCINEVFVFASNDVYSLRSINRNDLRLPKCGSNILKISFSCNAVNIWNNVSVNIRSSVSYKTYLLARTSLCVDCVQ